MARVSVELPVLRWAIERAGLTPPMLERRFPKIHQWIDGEHLPTLKQLEQFSNATRTPLGFFFLDTPPEERLPIPFFRTIDDGQEALSRPSPDLLETIHAMQRRQFWLREYLIDMGHEPLPFVGSANTDSPPTEIASRIRHTFNLGEDWAGEFSTWEEALDAFRAAIEKAGILVVFNGVVGNNNSRALNTHEFRGFVLVDDYAPLLFVNNKDVKAAKMFTLAHELAHVFLGSGAVFDLRDMAPADNHIELFCNQIAAEFLVPERRLREYWPTAIQQAEPFAFIARCFKVSDLVAARRALDLGLIRRSEFIQFYNWYLTDDRRKAQKTDGGGNFYSNQNFRIGKRFALIVAQAAREGKLSYYEAYQLTGISGVTFDRYIASIEAGPRL